MSAKVTVHSLPDSKVKVATELNQLNNTPRRLVVVWMYSHSSLTLVRVGSKWSALLSGRFIARCMRLGGPQGRSENGDNYWPYRGSNSDPSVFQPAVPRYTVSSALPSLHPSLIQIFPSAPCSQTPSPLPRKGQTDIEIVVKSLCQVPSFFLGPLLIIFKDASISEPCFERHC
jgi:hypothetical protein